jgi:hypothetical protein
MRQVSNPGRPASASNEKQRTLAPTDFTVRAAGKLQTALAGNDAALFSTDAVYEDMTLRAQVLGRLAIERYLGQCYVLLVVNHEKCFADRGATR